MNKDSHSRVKARKDALDIFLQAIRIVNAGRVVRDHISVKKDTLSIGQSAHPFPGIGRCIAIGAGKASAAMGRALEAILGDRLEGGHISVKYGHIHSLSKIRLTEAGHPIPDIQGVVGATAIWRLALNAGADDLIIGLFSGGGSALLPLPHEGISLEDKQKAVSVLIDCGASIHEINTLRKHLSGIKGGRLARAAYPARMVALFLSDVVGDALDVIASGPTVPDPSTFSDCMTIVSKYSLGGLLPKSVMNLLKKGLSGNVRESPKPGDPVFEKTENLIIGSNSQALRSAKEAADRLGYNTVILSSAIQGDTREAARFHVAVAGEILRTGNPVPRPACLLSGGETTVVVSGKGAGGRNQEFALQAALDISGMGPLVVFSAGTDGTDGPTDAAGAVADDTTVLRAHASGMDPFRYLNNNDAYPFFKTLDDLVVTGPTDTNVMDLRIVLVP